jgi:hypothetical protein
MLQRSEFNTPPVSIVAKKLECFKTQSRFQAPDGSKTKLGLIFSKKSA